MIILGRSSLSDTWKFGAFGYDGEGLRAPPEAYDCQSWVCVQVLCYHLNLPFWHFLLLHVHPRWGRWSVLCWLLLILTYYSHSLVNAVLQSTCWKILQARSKVGLARGGGFTREHEGSLEVASSAGTFLSDVLIIAFANWHLIDGHAFRKVLIIAIHAEPCNATCWSFCWRSYWSSSRTSSVWS
jgi:hypothetical protein